MWEALDVESWLKLHEFSTNKAHESCGMIFCPSVTIGNVMVVFVRLMLLMWFVSSLVCFMAGILSLVSSIFMFLHYKNVVDKLWHYT